MSEIDIRRLADRAADALREEILSGRQKPGERLRENELSSRLGLSRTPLRDALRRLTEEGLVVIKPYCGASVAQVDDAEEADLREVRVALELLAVRTLAQRFAVADAKALRAIAARIEEQAGRGDRGKEFLADGTFHRALAERSGNGVLADALARIDGRVQLVRLKRRLNQPADLAVLAAHGRIIDALEAGEGERAERILEEHIRGGWATAP
jgi:DNA-binding GntR family transcriptional regulator